MARSVLSSLSVKSSVNQPVNLTPSITLVVLRPANSGWSATLVVPPISGLVAGDEHAVLGADEVGLDVVGAELGGEAVGRERVLGAVARRRRGGR